jgi:ribosome-associated heat shock protein Hsp15
MKDALVVVIGGALLVAGCSSSVGEPASATSAPPPAAPLTFAECGSLSDAQVRAVTGIAGLTRTFRNALTCSFDSGTGKPRAEFAWFRGVPVDERRGSDSGARISDVTIGGRAGFTAERPGASCESAVDAGGGDFVDWTIDFGASGAPADACAKAVALAAVTLQNAG